ncbi:restriction endonuclease [Lentibacillus salinarum]|uniref:Restriction endonuclease n=1 Tax=Lentibacillus salinarum TaxID=446820 RepID=A0ABW3ZW79_9BACI
MARRKKVSIDNLFVFGLMGLVVFLFLLNRVISWLTSLPTIAWFVIIGFIITAILAKRHINHLRKLKEAEQRRLRLERKRNLDDLKKMLPSTFEHYTCDLFRQFGYDAHVTPVSGDSGKDIMIYKQNMFAIAECKRYDKTKVTRPDIQKFHSALIDCKADKGYFVTTGDFTSQAKSYVLDKPIEMINGAKLVHLIVEVTKDEQANKQLDAMLTQFNG